LHFAFCVMQLRTRSARGLVSQAFMKSPCIDDANPEDNWNPAVLPLVGYPMTKDSGMQRPMTLDQVVKEDL